MFGRSEFLRRVEHAVDAALAGGEQRRAAAFLRGPGPVGNSVADPGRDGDWVLVVTDRRVLLFPVVGTTRSAGGVGPDLQSYPRDAVQLVDATLRGAAPALVLRFPDAVLGWFHPMPAWRRETEQLVQVLREGREQADDAYPDENRQARERRVL